MRSKHIYNQLAPFTKPLIKAILLLLSFFIIIGEATRWIIRQLFILPRRVILFIFSLINSFKLPSLSFDFHIPKIKVKNPFQTNKNKKETPKKSKKAQKKVSFPSTVLKLQYFMLGLACSLALVGVFWVYQFIQTLPNPKLIGTLNYSVSSQIYDRKGRLIYEIYNDQNRTPVKLKDLPSYIAQATISIEDKDFYKHKGISISSGIIRAIKDMVLTRSLQGGSTITQQLVKSSLLSPERTIPRKIKEMILALWTEQIYSKNQILEMYLNQVPYGGSAYGIEEGAKTLYKKRAKDLTLPEAALLAGLPQAPTYYSPYTNPKLTLNRRNDVLKNMYEKKYISQIQYINAKKTPINIQPLDQAIKAPHFVFYIKSLLEKEYGVYRVAQGGLRVTTSLDLDLQKQLEDVLKEELEKVSYLNITNGAILVTEPSTGEILAMVGSRDYFASPSGSFNVTTALRQPGSSIKPLMYSLALERGYTAATIIDDTPITYYISGTDSYSPVNYDSKYHGKVTLRNALANSYNVPAVKVLNTLGVPNFIEHAQEMGITTWNEPERYGLSLTLGGAEVTMTDMSVAFGVFANQGKRVDLNSILSISDFRGNSIFTLDNILEKRVVSENTAFIISDILSDNIARRPAFGANSQLEIKNHQVAVKTGTTNDKKDNWTIGYTPKFLASVWVGNNDNTAMNPFLTSGITGAAPIWNRTMTYLLDKYKYASNAPDTFPIPGDIVRRICGNRIEYFEIGTENKINCSPLPSLPLPSISPYLR